MFTRMEKKKITSRYSLFETDSFFTRGFLSIFRLLTLNDFNVEQTFEGLA